MNAFGEKVNSGLRAVQTFFMEVRTELKKCSWPTRPELVGSTGVVIVAVVLLALFVGLSDLVLNKVMQVIIRG